MRICRTGHIGRTRKENGEAAAGPGAICTIKRVENEMKEITVVIPNYNGITYLKDCLEALHAQEPGTPDFEVVVVDNGSTDGSAQQASVLFPGIRVLCLSENTGFCHAVNVGIRESECPYILLLNNDTKVKPGFVKSLYHAISENALCFSASAKMLMWDRPELIDDAGDQYNVLGWAYARGKGKNIRRYEKRAKVFSACGGAAIYRRSLLEQTGLFDELHFAYLEDLDIGYRARIYGFYNVYQPAAEVVHYGSASTGSRYNSRKTVLAAANSVYVIFKNMPFFQILWNSPFLILGFLVKFLFFSRKRMGKLYLKGLREGLKRSFSAEGRSRHVGFRWNRIGNYLRIQLALYANLFRMMSKFL